MPVHWQHTCAVVALLGMVPAGCVTMTGPCRLSAASSASQAEHALECGTGGSANLLAPRAALEAVGGLLRAASAPASSP